MDSVLGGGVLLAVAAALWLAYLVPNWLRRSEYLATERNAVRLQQTIRVLAETAETPEAVRLENAAKARALEAQLRRRPVAVGTPVTLPDASDPRVGAAARLRRTRIATSVIIAIAGIILVAQLVVVFVGGFEAASPLLVAFSAGFLIAGLWLQRRLSRVARSQRSATVSTSTVSSRPAPLTDYAIGSGAERDTVAARDWTPAPVPQPLYQLRREAALRSAQTTEARAAREAALVEARETARSLVEEPAKQASRNQAPEPAKTPSRFAAMGVLGELDSAMPDIDGALARRRAS